VIEREVISRGFRVGMNIFKQSAAGIEILGDPGGIRSFFVQAQIRDRLFCGVKLALLVVIVENARGRLEIFRIPVQVGAGLVQEFSETLSLSEQVEVALYQFRLPQRLKALLIYGK